MSEELLRSLISKFVHIGKIRRLCNDYNVCLVEAEQELFVRMLEKSRRNVVLNPESWVHSNGYGYLRHFLFRCKGRFYSLSALNIEPAVENIDSVERNECIACITHELSKLTILDRDCVLAYRQCGGQSCREIAKKHSISHETVRNRARKIIPLLQSRLEGLV